MRRVMCYIHRRRRETQTANSDGEGGRRRCSRVKLRCNSLKKEGLLGVLELRCREYTHTVFFPLIYSTYIPTEVGLFLRGRCSSCTVAHVLYALCFTYAVVGWMEDRAKCFHLSASIVMSSGKDILTDRKERHSRKKR